MKTTSCIVVIFLLSGIMAFAQGPEKMKKRSKNMVMPYEAEYSSKFKIGDDRHSLKVLELWKDFEDNDFDRNREHLAEDLTMDLADGTRLTGREEIMNSGKNYREQLSNFRSKIISYISLQSVDRDEEWVGIWGEDTFTDANGEESSNAIHEIWRFNKEGKVDYIRQYMSKAMQDSEEVQPEDHEDHDW